MGKGGDAEHLLRNGKKVPLNPLAERNKRRLGDRTHALRQGHDTTGQERAACSTQATYFRTKTVLKNGIITCTTQALETMLTQVVKGAEVPMTVHCKMILIRTAYIIVTAWWIKLVVGWMIGRSPLRARAFT